MQIPLGHGPDFEYGGYKAWILLPGSQLHYEKRLEGPASDHSLKSGLSSLSPFWASDSQETSLSLDRVRCQPAISTEDLAMLSSTKEALSQEVKEGGTSREINPQSLPIPATR